MAEQRFDVVVFGASSFVGQILCRYLLTEFGPASTGAPPTKRQLRWAMAGRSKTKLTEVRNSLGAAAADIPLLVADSSDAKALRKMAEQARVVVSTVGPYALYGDALVKACAELGTDYCDLTGEAHWVRKMINMHEATAQKSGARIVHCCGFDSIPSDLGVYYLQQQARARLGTYCNQVQMAVKAMRGAASGGTVASMVNVVREATKDRSIRRVYSNPYSLCVGALVTQLGQARQLTVSRPFYDKDFKVWLGPFIMAAINMRIVLRSHAISGYPYGVDFRYSEAMMMGSGLKGRVRATTFALGLGAFATGAALAPTRWLMERTILPASGSGPSAAAQERGFWDYRFIGTTKDGRTLRAKVTGDRDPGYGSTAKMLGEAAACLALDIPKADLDGGFWTPATAMGEKLIARLTTHAGVTFSAD